MTLKKHPPLKEMFASLPEGTLTEGDTLILKTLSASMAGLREPASATTVFTVEVRGALLSRLKQSVADALAPHMPPPTRGRPADPFKAALASFTTTLKALVALVDLSWSASPDERTQRYAGPRAALDKAYAALRAVGTNPVFETAWKHLDAALDAYTTHVFDDGAKPFGETDAGIEMRAALKTLVRTG